MTCFLGGLEVGDEISHEGSTDGSTDGETLSCEEYLHEHFQLHTLPH